MGLTKGFSGNRLRLDVNYFRRHVNNYADDDQVLNTAVSFPIAFRKAIIYGAEGKLEVPSWRRIFRASPATPTPWGMPGIPVTGGLLLGEDAVSA